MQSSLTHLSRALKRIDMFGIQPSLTFENKQHYNTNLGGAASVFLFGFVTYFFTSTMLCIQDGEHPLISTKVEQNQQTFKKFQMNSENFFVSLALADKYGKPIVNTDHQNYYSTIFYLCSQTVNQSAPNCKDLRLIKCDSDWVNTKIKKIIPKQRQQDGYCLNDTLWQEMFNFTYLEGTPISLKFSYFKLIAKPCDNQSKLTCAPDLKDRMSQGYSYMIFSDFLIDQKQISNPFKLIGKQNLDSFDLSWNKKVILNYQFSEFNTTENFYYFNQINRVLGRVQLVNQQTNYIKRDKEFLTYLWMLSDQQMTTMRSYDTIIDALAQSSAILQLLVFIFEALLHPLTVKSLNLRILKCVFRINDPDQVEFESEAKDIVRQIGKGQIEQKDLNEVQKKNIESLFSKNHSIFGPSELQMFKSFLKLNDAYVEAGLQKIMEKLDINFLLKQLIEVEKLKYVLLNEDQHNLFELIEKPQIEMIPQDQSQQKEPVKMNMNLLKLSRQMISFLNVRNDKDPISRRLLQIIDKDILKFFDSSQKEGQNQSIESKEYDSEEDFTSMSKSFTYTIFEDNPKRN